MKQLLAVWGLVCLGAVALGTGVASGQSAGSIVGWGMDVYGQATPPEGNDYIAIAAGGLHSLALKSDGSVVGWGWNDYGQITVPAGLKLKYPLPSQLIAGGVGHSLVLKSDGTVVTWGDNSDGQITVPAGLTGVMKTQAPSSWSRPPRAGTFFSHT